MAEPPAIELTNVVKDYKGLRPLRIARWSVARGERVAISGLDRPAAETLISLLTGAAVSDGGDVRVFGRSTAAMASGDEWLASLDRFGIVTERAAMLEGSTLAQNLALSFTLSIDPVPPDVRLKVLALAREAGLEARQLEARPADSTPHTRARVQLARAVALEPSILLLEHPTASLPRDAAAAFGDDVAKIARERGITAVAITEDGTFARRAAQRYLKLNGATGEVAPVKRFFFSRG